MDCSFFGRIREKIPPPPPPPKKEVEKKPQTQEAKVLVEDVPAALESKD